MPVDPHTRPSEVWPALPYGEWSATCTTLQLWMQIVGKAVALQAVAEGVADAEDASSLEQRLRDYVWEPVYLPYERID